MLRCILLDLIFGHIFHLRVLKDFKIMKVDFIKSTEIFSKKLKLNKLKHLVPDKI